MIRTRSILLALLIAATPVAAAAQSGLGDAVLGEALVIRAVPSTPLLTLATQIDGARRDKARDEAESGQRLSLSDIVRVVQSGREGRMLGVRPSGDSYVVRWEYPGGRIVDITVDARSGRITGER